MRRGLLAAGLVIAVMAALVSVPAFLGLALGHSPSESVEPNASATAVVPLATAGASLAPVAFHSDDGYRMTLPGSWTASSLDGLQQQLLLNVLRNSDAEVASLLDTVLAGTGGRISMVAGDVHGLGQSTIPPNVSVIAHPANADTAASAARRVAGVLASADGVGTGVRTSETSVAGLPAQRVDWTLHRHTAGTQGAAPEAILTTYVVVSRQDVLLVTLARSSASTAGSQQLDSILTTFALEQSAGK